MPITTSIGVIHIPDFACQRTRCGIGYLELEASGYLDMMRRLHADVLQPTCVACCKVELNEARERYDYALRASGIESGVGISATPTATDPLPFLDADLLCKDE